MSDVAERFVACAGWRWWAGMQDMSGDRVIKARTIGWDGLDDGPSWSDGGIGPARRYWVDGDPLPDVNDPGTLGCIEHGLLPEAYGPECTITIDLDVRVTSGDWAATLHAWDASDIDNPTHAFDARGSTRTEALAAVLLLALEGAPS